MYDKNTDYFILWKEDKESMIGTMIRNMVADLEAGYHYFGTCIQKQERYIKEYSTAYDAEMDKIAEMEPNKVNHYCYVKLLKAGAIS